MNLFMNYRIEESSKPKIKAKVDCLSTSLIKVTPRMENEKRDPQEVLQELAVMLPKVVVCVSPNKLTSLLTNKLFYFTDIEH